MAAAEPLVVPVLFLAAGIVLARVLAFTPAEAWAAFALSSLVAVAAWWKVSPRAARIGVFASALWLGAAVDARREALATPEIDFTPGETMLLEGCVVEPPKLGREREQFVLELAEGARARVNWYARKGETLPDLHYGQRIELEARLRKPRNYGNPGAFDFAGYLARREIYWLATANSRSKLTVLEGRCASRILAGLYRIREAALDRIDRMFASDAYAAGVARAVLLGDTARLEDVWTEDYRRTGTYHALVISGLHLTVLAGCFLFPMRVLGVSAGWSMLWTSLAAWTYALLAGGGAPVVRAAAGLTLYTLCGFFYREPRILNLLAAVAVVFLLADPGQLFDASFQMSFLAVAVIGGVALPLLDRTTSPCARAMRSLANLRWDPHLEPRLAQMRIEMRLLAETLELVLRLPRRLGQWMLSGASRLWFFTAELFLISLAVQAGMALPMVVYFHRLPVTGITANLLVVPLMNLFVPVGFAAVLTEWKPLAGAAAWLLHTSGDVARWHASLEWSHRVPDPPLWLAIAFLAVFVLLVASFKRTAAIRVAALAGFGLALGLMAAHPFAPRVAPGLLEVTAIDVGQGDSLLIVSPEGRTLLVDTGGFPVFGGRTRAPVDVGEDVVSSYLFTRAIRRLDVVAVTHAHEDHIGGLRAIVENFRPREIWTGAFPESESWKATRSWLAGRKIGVRALRAGDRMHWGRVDVLALSPPAGYLAGTAPSNNDSLVLRLDFGESSFLLTGDIERPVEASLLEGGHLREADVLKVAHHGSRSSTTTEFLEAARPRWAIVSNGADNLFRHPHPDVVERLEQAGARILRTDLLGQVRFTTDGRRWQVESFRWPWVQVETWRRPAF